MPLGALLWTQLLHVEELPKLLLSAVEWNYMKRFVLSAVLGYLIVACLRVLMFSLPDLVVR